MNISFDLTGPQEQALTAAAARLQVRPDELVAAALRDLVAHPAADFEAAANRVFAKNTELYRRLS